MRFRILLVAAAVTLTACGRQEGASVVVFLLDDVSIDSIGPNPAPCTRTVISLVSAMTVSEIRRAVEAARVCPP